VGGGAAWRRSFARATEQGVKLAIKGEGGGGGRGGGEGGEGGCSALKGEEANRGPHFALNKNR